MPSMRQKKLRAAVYATRHGIPFHGVHPNVPGAGKPTKALWAAIRRYAHLREPRGGGWDQGLEWILFPSEHAQEWRTSIVGNAYWAIRNRSRIFYSMGGARLAELDHPYTLPLYTDCSALVKLLYAWARPNGIRPPDPTGMGWDNEGYTGDMLKYAQHITQAVALAGDFAVISKYGDDDGSHAVTLLQNGTRLLTGQRELVPLSELQVCSHGGDGAYAARQTTMQVELDGHEVNGHPARVTFLRVIH